ncbi:MAG TPA: glutamine amidotransferase [Candidatus Saccharimonadales bacterium]|nr:glutamine amidotransferase [Candidatus Saccharimonadales bacterium]
MEITLCHLYPYSMNIYGDTGNMRTLEYRLVARGFKVNVLKADIGDKISHEVDIIVAGGGQDSGQLHVKSDLHKRKKEILSLHDDGVVFLTICGTYQLLGHRFTTHSGDDITGLGVFNLQTKGSSERLIGNIVVDSPFGTLVGFENHSGLTYLDDDQQPLGKVLKGAGNNGQTGDEGAISKNAFGTYLHGPILPKNPKLADELIRRALKRKYGFSDELVELDDREENKAAAIALELPR